MLEDIIGSNTKQLSQIVLGEDRSDLISALTSSLSQTRTRIKLKILLRKSVKLRLFQIYRNNGIN